MTTRQLFVWMVRFGRATEKSIDNVPIAYFFSMPKISQARAENVKVK